jgi:integrase
MNALTTSAQSQQQHISHAIATSAKLGERTKAQYQREVTKATAAGVNLLDAAQVADYASELSTSSRSFLRAALKTWTKRVKLETKAGATPDSMNVVNATIARLEALDSAIELEASSGQKAHTWLTASEVKRLMASVNGRTGRRDRVVLALLVGAGLRRDELVTLKWEDVKRQGERVVLDVMGKGQKARVIPISPALAAILEDWRTFSEGAKSERVVRGLASGGRLTDSLTSSQVFNIVRKYGARIGKPELAPHDARRTFAQLGYENGVPVTQLSRLLGHSSIETTQRYLNLELNLDVTASDFVPL